MYFRSNPDSRSRAPHLDELAAILAGGLMRLFARKSSGKGVPIGESSLDFSPTESGHLTPVEGDGSDD